MNKYPIVVFWSDEDECWIADAPDLKTARRMDPRRKKRCVSWPPRWRSGLRPSPRQANLYLNHIIGQRWRLPNNIGRTTNRNVNELRGIDAAGRMGVN